mgnify:FL=1
MAITKTQQARQMLRNGKRVGLFGGMSPGAFGRATGGGYSDKERAGNKDNEKDNNPRRGGAGPFLKPKSTKPKAPPGRPEVGSTPQINRFELAEKNRKEKERKERILEEQRRKQQLQRTGIANTSKFGSPKGTFGDAGSKTYGPFSLKDIKIAESAIEDDDEDDAATAKEIVEQNIFEKILGNIPSVTGVLKKVLPKNPFDKIIGEIEDDPGLLEKVNKRLGINLADDAGKKKYKELRQQGVIGAYGRPMGGFKQDKPGGAIVRERDNEIIPQVVPTTTAPTTTTSEAEAEDVDDINRRLAIRFAGSEFDFADGGRVPAMGGGIMNTDIIGGFADDSMDQMGRQMYGLGKLVKKAVKGVKKIAKSPVGKAALLYFGGNALTGGGLKSFLLGSNAGPSFSKTGILKKMFLKNPSLGFSLGNISPVAGIFGTSALAGLMTPKQEEENEEQYLGPSFDVPIPGIRARRRLAAAFDGSTYDYEDYADGGRIGYQDGSKEPVAKKTMPLLDMDGMEKDYRETGGFVEMGRMERADDVPARLSKNEFVFTADAVRNAGEGNIDKGAEVMYNMMKNLESGGEVSEESQGLEGARKMFQTSQRLGEVI